MTLRDDFRGPLPLRDSDFAEMRRSVLSKLERRERRSFAPLALRFALAAAAVVVLVIIFMPKETSNPIARRTPIATTAAPAQTASSPAPPEVASPAAAREVVEASTPSARRVTEAPQKRSIPKAVEPERIATAGAAPSDTDIVMNIQTADPNVRIIWIARR